MREFFIIKRESIRIMIMYPNGPTPPPSQLPNSNPYDFLTQQPGPSNKLPINLSSKKSKVIAIGGVLAVIFLIFTVMSSIFGGGDSEQTLKYVTIAKSQTEIIRLADLAEKNAAIDDTKSLALTAQYAVSSSQKDMTELLGKRGVGEKDLSKQLTASKNSESDKLLESATQNNRYDETVIKLIFQELEDYQKELKNAASGATKSEYAILDEANKQIELILLSKPIE